MKRIKHMSRTKKFVAAAVTVGLTVGLAGAAFAYFTTSGTGTGHATTGSLGGNNFVVTSAADTAADLAPTALGDHNAVIDTLNYSVLNNQDKSDAGVNQIVFSISPTWSAGAAAPFCTYADFSINGLAAGATSTVTPTADSIILQPSSDGTTAPTAPWSSSSVVGDTYYGTYTLQLVESGHNQDNCEGVVVPVTIAVS